MSLSTLQAPRVSLASLTDDSLLVILGHFTVPQLLVLLSVSKKLYHIIVQYILPRYRTILLPYLSVDYQLLKQSIFFSRRYLAHSTLYVPALFVQDNERPPKNCILEQLFKSQLCSFPLYLPRLLPHLQSFTFFYFFEDDGLLNSKKAYINILLTGYLRSTWSETLVSLKLCFGIGPRPSAERTTFLFEQLNQLHSLRNLFLHFVSWDIFTQFQLPDSIPVFGQLLTFSLHFYNGANSVNLLPQLSPNLTFLCLSIVSCSFANIVTFLSSKSSYKRTLTTLELNLNGFFCPITGPQMSTLIDSCLLLQRFSGPFLVEVRGKLSNFFHSFFLLMANQIFFYIFSFFCRAISSLSLPTSLVSLNYGKCSPSG